MFNRNTKSGGGPMPHTLKTMSNCVSRKLQTLSLEPKWDQVLVALMPFLLLLRSMITLLPLRQLEVESSSGRFSIQEAVVGLAD